MSIAFYIYSISRFNWITHFYISYKNLISKVKFILSSISNGWLFWSVNHSSVCEDSELNIFKKIENLGEVSNRIPNCLLGTNVYKPLESCW